MGEPRPGKLVDNFAFGAVDVPRRGEALDAPELQTEPQRQNPDPLKRTAVAGQCRMRDCVQPASDKFGFCGEHHRRLADDARFCPCVIKPIGDEGVTGMYCALCDAQVWPLRRSDEVDPNYWPIDATPNVEGRCWIVDGGFRVVDGRLRNDLLGEGTPLYRTHPSVCSRRPMQSERRPESYDQNATMEE